MSPVVSEIIFQEFGLHFRRFRSHNSHAQFHRKVFKCYFIKIQRKTSGCNFGKESDRTEKVIQGGIQDRTGGGETGPGRECYYQDHIQFGIGFQNRSEFQKKRTRKTMMMRQVRSSPRDFWEPICNCVLFPFFRKRNLGRVGFFADTAIAPIKNFKNLQLLMVLGTDCEFLW